MKRLLFIFLASTALLSCKQRVKSIPKSVEKETANSVRTYTYADPDGKLMIIQNSLPRGGPYTDSIGKKYFKVVFWTQISNQTNHAVKFKVDFPVDSFEFTRSSGNYMRFFIPSDTMTTDKISAYDYGLTFNSLSNAIAHRAHSVERTINPNDSTAFYVVIRSDHGAGGALRTGLSLKGQNLIYKISAYYMSPELPLIDEKEFQCGTINFNNVGLQ